MAETSDARSSQEGISFGQFVFMQYQQAKLMLGEIPNPQTGRYERNLPVVRYTIETLRMLSHKTQGNLNDEERQILGNVLHELQMDYVAKMKEEGRSGPSGAPDEPGRPSSAGEPQAKDHPGETSEGSHPAGA